MTGDMERTGAAPSPLSASGRFYLAHGLGNDYLVFDAVDAGWEGGWEVTPSTVRSVCDRHEGVGSDGLVVLTERDPEDDVYPLTMFNPDGSEFERSGNGLRVAASHLFREGLVGSDPFDARCGGERVRLRVHGSPSLGRYDVSVELGTARVGLEAVAGSAGDLDAEGRAVHPSLGPVAFVPVSVGNPHAVVFPSGSELDRLDEIGPFLAGHPAFAHGTNVQIVRVLGPERLRIAIWERGVGPTTASGTSSCAAVAAAVSTGRLQPGDVTVEMEGGELLVSATGELDVTLRGPVDEVAEGSLASGFVERLARSG